MACCNGTHENLSEKAWKSWWLDSPKCNVCGDTGLVFTGVDWLDGPQYQLCKTCDKIVEYEVLGEA